MLESALLRYTSSIIILVIRLPITHIALPFYLINQGHHGKQSPSIPASLPPPQPHKWTAAAADESPPNPTQKHKHTISLI
jgi:hypothetical protein